MFGKETTIKLSKVIDQDLRHWAQGSDPDPAASHDEYTHIELIFCQRFSFMEQDSPNLFSSLESYFFRPSRNRYRITYPDSFQWPISYPIMRNSSGEFFVFFTTALLVEMDSARIRKIPKKFLVCKK